MCFCCDLQNREFDNSTHYTFFAFENNIDSKKRDNIINFIKYDYFDYEYFEQLCVQYFHSNSNILHKTSH